MMHDGTLGATTAPGLQVAEYQVLQVRSGDGRMPGEMQRHRGIGPVDARFAREPTGPIHAVGGHPSELKAHRK